MKPDTVTRSIASIASLVICFAFWWHLAVPPVPGSFSKNFLGMYPTREFVCLLGFSYLTVWILLFLWIRKPFHQIIKSFLVSTCSLILPILLLELVGVIGLVDYRLALAPPGLSGINRGNRFDPELLEIRRPMMRVHGTIAGDLVDWFGIASRRRYTFDIAYDERGFRNPLQLQEAPLVLIGDSFLEGALVSSAALLSNRLRELLGIEVANLGHGGYGPQQELAVLRRFGLPLMPNVVLWFFFEGNDLRDAVTYDARRRQLSEPSRKTGWTVEQSFSKNALRSLIVLTASFRREDSPLARHWSCRIGTDGNAREILYCGEALYDPLPEEDLEGLAIIQETLEKAKRLCDNAGALLILVYIPTKFRVYHDLCVFDSKSNAAGWKPNDLPARVRRWSQAIDIPFVDLTPPLKAVAIQGDMVYFPDDRHWNAWGHEIAARAVFRGLKNLGRSVNFPGDQKRIGSSHGGPRAEWALDTSGAARLSADASSLVYLR